jgi:hypothetical protein
VCADERGHAVSDGTHDALCRPRLLNETRQLRVEGAIPHDAMSSSDVDGIVGLRPDKHDGDGPLEVLLGLNCTTKLSTESVQRGGGETWGSTESGGGQ